jgi:hypothetical protein
MGARTARCVPAPAAVEGAPAVAFSTAAGWRWSILDRSAPAKWGRDLGIDRAAGLPECSRVTVASRERMPDGQDRGDSGLSPRVRDFLLTYVDSVESLEVLLMLAARPDLAFSPQRVASQLRSAVHSVRNRLRALTEHNLIARLEDAESFRMSVNPALAGVLVEVARAYGERPVAVVRMIHSRPSDLVRVFTDAFQRKKGANDH